jgi:DNA-binding NarL/FixJ family response regulator
LSVWLIEDNQLFGNELATALRMQEGIGKVETFGSAESALAAPPPAGFHVILLDLGLPRLSGLDALPKLRAKCPDAAITVLTVFAEDEKIFGALCAGATGYLLKTSTLSEVCTAIMAAASGGSPITPSIARRVLTRLSPAKKAVATATLSPRKRAVLEAFVKGMTVKAVAIDMNVSACTVDSYLRRIYQKLHVQSRAAAVAIAVREGLG